MPAARKRGDECGPLVWRHEVAHSLGRPPGQRRTELLIADAQLTYQQNGPGEAVRFHYRFVELDRATKGSERLAAQLACYARLFHRTLPAADPLEEPEPAWAKLYPVFPAVLTVIAGQSQKRFERRRRTSRSRSAGWRSWSRAARSRRSSATSASPLSRSTGSEVPVDDRPAKGAQVDRPVDRGHRPRSERRGGRGDAKAAARRADPAAPSRRGTSPGQRRRRPKRPICALKSHISV